ncbi:hypothetical protein LMG8520_0595 [Lactococcus lactis subsp. lactis]|uniref:Bacteriocin immunity protein n=2 Tax=Lactococcus lactis TaxID=1358 RepID=A0A2A5S8B8_LACLH|nr:bacteriocin immunity protein [Lactococcus lactis]KAA8699627.1 bacteriocin immunity protein [Lactococcus lactis subsp. hordniae]KSU13108.1 hypothetical protein LMG8520_0595 [Lactococcus lactis subsp. lactis]MCT3135224.1 bacteriocin immunity protein [Lactococcus lactis]PCS09736.1 hypothetical protein RU90_GL001839 [Lactococcus lactis subsp. hordniae]
MNKTFEKEEILNELYNLILDRNIRDWERQCLLHTKVQLENQGQLADELAKLEVTLRPLALRYNLTPKVAEFYQKITNSKLFGRGVGGII